ncbi:MAG: hypothetical protein Q8P67_09110, partial [archaeon]|nr:hypothetical protein [archaeon]
MTAGIQEAGALVAPEPDQTIAKLQGLLSSLRSAKQNAGEILSLLGETIEKIKNESDKVKDPRSSALLQKSLHHSAQLIARFVNELNTRMLTSGTCDEINMMLLHLDNLRIKLLDASVAAPASPEQQQAKPAMGKSSSGGSAKAPLNNLISKMPSLDRSSSKLLSRSTSKSSMKLPTRHSSSGGKKTRGPTSSLRSTTS